jgi:capsule polysaccharide export protein KpsE/RkpR
MIPIPERHDEKYMVMYKNEKIYIDADSVEHNSHVNTIFFKNKEDRMIASFPLNKCAIFLNNPSR